MYVYGVCMLYVYMCVYTMHKHMACIYVYGIYMCLCMCMYVRMHVVCINAYMCMCVVCMSTYVSICMSINMWVGYTEGIHWFAFWFFRKNPTRDILRIVSRNALEVFLKKRSLHWNVRNHRLGNPQWMV